MTDSLNDDGKSHSRGIETDDEAEVGRSRTVAVCLYGSIGAWDRAEVVRLGGEANHADGAGDEYVRIVVVKENHVDEVLDEYDIEESEVEEVHD